MPYEWLPSDDSEAWLHVWPHRSLSNRGFVAFIAASAGMLAVPLVALIGHPAVWVLLPFMALALGGVWAAIRRNDRDARLTEVLTLGPDRLTLLRRDPGGGERTWAANPYWVTVQLYPDAGPVPQYLTLKGGADGGGREVEIGAFLSEDERLALRTEIEDALRALR